MNKTDIKGIYNKGYDLGKVMPPFIVKDVLEKIQGFAKTSPHKEQLKAYLQGYEKGVEERAKERQKRQKELDKTKKHRGRGRGKSQGRSR